MSHSTGLRLCLELIRRGMSPERAAFYVSHTYKLSQSVLIEAIYKAGV